MKLNKMLTLLSICSSLLCTTTIAEKIGDMKVKNTNNTDVNFSTIKTLDQAGQDDSISTADLDALIAGANTINTFEGLDDSIASQTAASLNKVTKDILKYWQTVTDKLYDEVNNLIKANTASQDLTGWFKLITAQQRAAGRHYDMNYYITDVNGQLGTVGWQLELAAPVKPVAPIVAGNPQQISKQQYLSQAPFRELVATVPSQEENALHTQTTLAYMNSVEGVGYAFTQAPTQGDFLQEQYHISLNMLHDSEKRYADLYDALIEFENNVLGTKLAKYDRSHIAKLATVVQPK